MKRKLFGTALGGYLREKSGWLLGFAGTVALAKFLMRGEVIE